VATTKAYELAQLGNDLTVDSAGNLEFNTTVDLQYSGFDSDFGAKSTADLTEGSNLYYTDARADTRADARIAASSTDDLSEGSTNLYYTDARADARITAADTDDLSEGSTNLYYTDARANASADARIAAADTDDLSEGSTNLYYTDARADARITAADTDDLSEGSTNLYYTDARVDTRISGNRTFGNITTTGYIAGPATFTIDPAAVGDDTGTVVIAGSLQVDGTTTTINSATMTVDDLNIVLASGAVNASAANGAGITVDGASASITYDGTNDEWDFNKQINVAGNIVVSGTVDGRDVAADGTKLDGIESGATADQTAAQIKTAYESNSDTNEFSDAEQTKLAGIETGATADQTKADIDALNINADQVDGLDASSFLRSDASDSFTGTLSGSGSISISGGVTATPGSSLVVYNSAGTAVNTVYGISSS
jgi:hypothetical protein